MGAPLFGSPRDFVAAMQGQGQLGPLLAMIGMKPVQFQSVAEFQKSITTESKMFSIYAVGVKKGYRRETRVKIHAVVDFRNAPSLLAQAGAAGQPGATPGTTPTTPNPAQPGVSATGVAQSNPNAIGSAVAPNTGGTVVYFRVE
jgi:general secretion pathway protein K